jgi:hypothetical protein
MRFRHPIENMKFEIPDSWWIEAEAHLFERSTVSFAATSSPKWPTELVSIQYVAIPQRDPGNRILHKERTISLIQAIISGCEVPPLEVHRPPQAGRLAVRDGFHRYFISVALGFPMLPVSVRPYFDLDAP